MKKALYVIFFRSTFLVNAIKVTDQKTPTANWYPYKVFQKFFKKVVLGTRASR